MLDFESFRDEYPQFCREERIRTPGLAPEERPSDVEVKDSKEAYTMLLRRNPWEDPPMVRPLMEERGAEAFGHYRSFRLYPRSWGICIDGRPLTGLAKEILRVLNLGFRELEESVSLDVARELAFGMAFDIASNHCSFHAAVDAFAASHELEDNVEHYGPYMRGPYSESLVSREQGSGHNLEEVLANVVAIRSFLNPNLAVELGSLVNDSLDEEEQYRWNAYLMSGILTTELTYIMRAYPPGHRDFTHYLRRRGEVGPYAHMAIQYDLDAEAFNRGLRKLSGMILGGRESDTAEKELLKPTSGRLYLVTEK